MGDLCVGKKHLGGKKRCGAETMNHRKDTDDAADQAAVFSKCPNKREKGVLEKPRDLVRMNNNNNNNIYFFKKMLDISIRPF